MQARPENIAIFIIFEILTWQPETARDLRIREWSITRRMHADGKKPRSSLFWICSVSNQLCVQIQGKINHVLLKNIDFA